MSRSGSPGKGDGGTHFLPLVYLPAPAVMLRPGPSRELVPDAQVPTEMASDWGMPPALRAHGGPRTPSAWGPPPVLQFPVMSS